MDIDLKLIDKLLADYKNPEDIIGENGLLEQLTKPLLERAMRAELTDHLGYEKHDPAGHNSGNSRNGATTKTRRAISGRCPWRRRAIATAATNRRLSARAKPDLPVSTTRSSPCTHDAILRLVQLMIESGNHELIHRAAEDTLVGTQFSDTMFCRCRSWFAGRRCSTKYGMFCTRRMPKWSL